MRAVFAQRFRRAPGPVRTEVATSPFAELRRLGRRVNRKRVARVMRERDIRGVTRRRRRWLTRPDAKAKPPPDPIGRN